MVLSRRRKNGLNRRTFIGSLAGAGMVAGLSPFLFEERIAYAARDVNRSSAPSKLKITDMRTAVVKDAPMRCPLIRIDTNQGIYGLGEVRDAASEKYALFHLKSRILGENPCNIEKIFKRIKQFGHHGRQGGGVCAVEMALWDLAGKAYGVPVYQMLGGKYRDRIRIYCDTDMSSDPDVYAQRMLKRVEAGFTFLKMDLGIGLLKDIPNAITQPLGSGPQHDTRHPFTGIEITGKGIQHMADYVAAIRERIGYEIPLAADHFGHIGVNSCIRLGKALEPYQMAWLEDMIPWDYVTLWKKITDAIDVPTLTGEDIYLKEDFIANLSTPRPWI